MKKSIILFFLFFSALAIAQTQSGEIINEGIAFHDKGEYESALRKYDEVLKNDPANVRALYEKSFTLFQMKKYDECEVICKQLLQGKEYRKEVYVQYGNLLDVTNRQKESLELYNKGIREFPDFSLLYFNRGITLTGLQREDEAISSFQQALKLKPLHASSHYAIGKLVKNDSRVPGIMSLFTFLIIEPQSERSKESLQLLKNLMTKGVSQTDSGNVTISIDAGLLDKKNKKSENDFSDAELMLSLGGSLAQSSDANKSETEAEQLKKYLDLMISLLSEKKKKAKGFFWTFYAPFFGEMESKDYVTTASYIAYSSSNDDQVNQWLKDNSDKTNAFYEWLKNYQWNTK